ncbi:MAG: hypothetical protein KGL39_34430 [Patescibacteria group bacterium]|nr:hypothetical protein [Patescibacteria group bacterium]
MQIDFSNPETIHIALIIGQYTIAPIALWAARKFKNSIVDDLKAHVDLKIAEHEKNEMDKFEEFSDRITRLEDVIMRRGARPAAWGRRDAKGRFAVSNV